MALSNEQITALIDMISTTESDEVDCDGCLEHLAEFAEAELSNQEVSEAIKTVKRHLEQCRCCQDEYNALLEGLRELENPAV